MRAVFPCALVLFPLVGCGASAAVEPPPPPLPPPVVPAFVVETPIDAHCPTGMVNDLDLNCVPHEPVVPRGMARMPSEDGFFWMDVTEVTASAYNQCVAAKACVPAAVEDDAEGISDAARANTRNGCTGNKPERGAYPINCVSFKEARTYCAWVGKRLPTAAEWERAATGPVPRRFPWGDFVPGPKDICWTAGKNRDYEEGPCLAGTHPLDTSPYGVKDMGGSLSEFVEEDAYRIVNPFTPKTRYLVPGPPHSSLRGGNWIERYFDSSVENTEITRWRGTGPMLEGHSWFMGFRCAQSGT